MGIFLFYLLMTCIFCFRYTDRANIEEFFFIIQTKINANRHKSYRPPEGRSISDISKAWEKMEKAEHRREIGLREELARYLIVIFYTLEQPQKYWKMFEVEGF